MPGATRCASREPVSSVVLPAPPCSPRPLGEGAVQRRVRVDRCTGVVMLSGAVGEVETSLGCIPRAAPVVQSAPKCAKVGHSTPARAWRAHACRGQAHRRRTVRWSGAPSPTSVRGRGAMGEGADVTGWGEASIAGRFTERGEPGTGETVGRVVIYRNVSTKSLFLVARHWWL